MKEYIITDDFLDDLTMKFASAQGQLKELIRCKDCKYLPGTPRLYADDDPVESYIHCGHLGEDGFCSFAKRREE